MITWTPASPISYGTALGAAQLDAVVTGSIAGTLVYTPASGAVLAQGPQTLSVTFTPTDTTDYKPVTQTVSIQVNKAVLTVTAASQTVTYGTALAPVQLHHHPASSARDTQTSATSGTPSLVTPPATPVSIEHLCHFRHHGRWSHLLQLQLRRLINGQITINKATLTLTANNASRPYNTPNPDLHRDPDRCSQQGHLHWKSFHDHRDHRLGGERLPDAPAAAGTNTGQLHGSCRPRYSHHHPGHSRDHLDSGRARSATVLRSARLPGLTPSSPDLIAGTALVYTPASGAVLAQGPQTLSGDVHPDRHDRLQAGDPDGEHPGEQGCSDGHFHGQPDGHLRDGALAPYSYTITGFVNEGHADFGHQRHPSLAITTAGHRSTSAPMPSPPQPVVLTSSTTASSSSTAPRSRSARPLLTVTAANASRAYGAANPTFSATVTGAQGTDTFTTTESTTATTASPVGTYPIVPRRRRRQPGQLHRGLYRQRHHLLRRTSHPRGHREQRQPRLRCREPDLLRHGHRSPGRRYGFTTTESTTATTSIGGHLFDRSCRRRHQPGQLHREDLRQRHPHRRTGHPDGHRGQRLPHLRCRQPNLLRHDHRVEHSMASPSLRAPLPPQHPRSAPTRSFPSPPAPTLANYTVVYVNGTLTVGQATLTVTAGNASAPTVPRTRPSPPLQLEHQGDTFTFTESTTTTATSPVGTYPIVPVATGANLANYTVVYVNGTLTVEASLPSRSPQATPPHLWSREPNLHRHGHRSPGHRYLHHD